MKLECSKEKLKDAVFKSERMTGKNLSLPILGSVLLLVNGKVLKIRATNLDIGIEVEVPIKNETKGIIAVPGNILSHFLSHVQDDIVVLESQNNNLVAKSRKNKAVIKSFPYEDFPTLPTVEKDAVYTIPAHILLSGLKSVVHSAGTSDIKPEIASVFLYSDDEKIFFVATDSFRLSEKIISIKNMQGGKISFIIPIRNVVEIIRVFEGCDDDVEITADKNQIAFRHGGVYVTSRIIDGVFPDYKQIIPAGHKTDAVVLKNDLLDALKATQLFSDKSNQVTMRINPKNKQFVLSSENPDVGENKVVLEAACAGEPMEVRFNQRYLLDCLQSITQDSVSLQCNGDSKPLVVRNIGDDSFTALVMPLNQ